MGMDMTWKRSRIEFAILGAVLTSVGFILGICTIPSEHVLLANLGASILGGSGAAILSICLWMPSLLPERDLGGLTEIQFEMLRDLGEAVRYDPGPRITTMTFGGSDNYHYGATLTELCKKGVATRCKPFLECSCKCGPGAMFGHRCAGEFWYGITEKGMRILSESKS
jgi:hypothetical protein